MSERTILHCDCNSFFASVETVYHPEFQHVPMAVCGSTEDRHGIVLAKNELAKAYHIQTAETVYSAKKKCPSLVITPPHYELYVRYSQAVREILARFTDQIEPFGLDECWLDVTDSRRAFGTGPEIAERIRRAVREELGITVSIGVSFTKTFAKLGSDYKKPDAITCIGREAMSSIVYPLPVGELLFVGKRTETALQLLGIRTIGELAAADVGLLSQRLGKMGLMLSRMARGEDDSPVAPPSEDSKSIGNGFTFRHDLVSMEQCRAGIDFLCEEIGQRLRDHGQRCTTVVLRIKDENLHVIQKQRPISPPTDIARRIAEAAYALLSEHWSIHRPIRMLNVTATGLVKASEVVSQMDFFSQDSVQKDEKSKKVEHAKDEIRRRFGAAAIVPASVIDTDIGVYDKKQGKKGPT